MSIESSEFTAFRPHLEHHTKLGNKIENVLEEGKEYETKEVARLLVEEAGKEDGEEGVNMEKSFVRSIISEAADYYSKKNKIVIDRRKEGSGGNPTIFWRLEK